ncbi:class I SAM-dependent methyltransferase [Halovivax sp.]|uniref:class I SAM-dependent methyltransferase n=1 Tax=Halovivax sp. TaxID=1935978 RepID=UPI003742A5FE
MTDDARRKRDAATSFGAAADAYRESEPHRRGADLDRIAAWCADADRALDVATGAGHAAGALRRAGVETVVAADAAPEMVATAVREFDARGVVGDAERLPFDADSFDAVTCRIAAHHFPNPRAFVEEVARVLRPGGTFAFEDNVAPNDRRLATFLNRLERERDPSHVESDPVATWRERLTDAGLSVTETVPFAKTLEVESWLEAQSPTSARRRRVLEMLRDAPPAARETFDIRATDGTVTSWRNPKVLIRATRPD